MNRRTFLRIASTGVACAGVTSLSDVAFAASSPGAKPKWPIGCFNRAWTNWFYDEALDGIRDAGYKLTGLLTFPRGESFTLPSSTPKYLDDLKKRIAQRGLAVNMTTLNPPPDKSLDENIANARKQIENAARLELKFMLSFGVDKPQHYENFYRIMADAAAQAEKHGIQIVMKPHGGASGASQEILRCIEKVAHPNFKIWYDAGNIIYYTDKDPLAELEPVAKYVRGFCAKDCAKKHAEVMSQFGTGKVDFKAVFAKLKSVGFNGPIMVEGIKVGATAAETTANARANREFLETVLASI